jgi:hypothetical protein
MLDHEYISELAIAYLHGPQNKKDRLDHYYQLYEEAFEDRERIISDFRKITGEVQTLLPRLLSTRWRKKSDFYTLFLSLALRVDEFPWAADRRIEVSRRLMEFGERIDALLRIEEADWVERDQRVLTYARNVARAASDRGNRVARAEAFSGFVLGQPDAAAAAG